MDAREILLRHISEDKSDRMKAFMKIVNYDAELAAMQEYAELYRKAKQVDEKQCMKLSIKLDEYNYKCGDGCCDHYGIITTVNCIEMQSHNTDKETILCQILEHLGYAVEIINIYDGEEI